jgi:hypothetical protein
LGSQRILTAPPVLASLSGAVAPRAPVAAAGSAPLPPSLYNQTRPVQQPQLLPVALNRDVELSPLSLIPNKRIVRYLGAVNFSFIRESNSIARSGGLSSFMDALVNEVNSVVRGYVAALQGNALLNYRFLPRETAGGAGRNQAYYFVTISGDAAEVEPELP